MQSLIALNDLQSLSSAVSVKGTSMNIWLFLLLLAGIGFVCLMLGFMAGAAIGHGRRGGDGKPWWYEQAFPKPDEATVGAMTVIADRYALGEIDEDEFNERITALRESSLSPADRAKRDGKAAISEYTRDEIRRSLDKQSAKRK